MIIDSSVLIAIVTGEPEAEMLLAKMEMADSLAISAATLAEVLIVAQAKGKSQLGDELVEDVNALLADLFVDVIPFDEAAAQRAAAAWKRFGKGHHPASLNFGDCLSYAAAQGAGEPLLFIGADFGQTDIAAA